MKKFICGLLAILLLVTLCGCAKKGNEFFDEEGRFVTLYMQKNEIFTGHGTYDVSIFYDKATSVMYMIIEDGGRCGVTPLLCEDGTPIIYDPIDNSVG